MKKLSIFLLALVACAGTMFASDTSVDGIWYNFDDEHLTAEVTYQGDKHSSSSNEYSGKVVIPSSVTYNAQTYSVTSIGEDAFRSCSLTSVTIPNSVTSIGNSAFAYCRGLTTIDVAPDNPNYCSEDGVLFNRDKTTLIQCPGGKQGDYTVPNSVTSIGEYALSSCTGLTSVTIPNSVTGIGNYAFYGCSGLTSVTIGNSVTGIGNYAFHGCSGLTSIDIPNSVTSIGNDAFYGCSGLTSVTIPNSVTSIGSFAFYGCSSLTSVTIPNSVTSIGTSAFYNVPNIVYSGEATGSPWGARSVNGYVDGYLVYSDNTKTTLLACYSAAQGEIIIPNSVTSIGNYAFYGCSGLTSIDIPNSVTSIGNDAFYGCSGLTSVTIPNSVTSIGSFAFYGCSSLTSVTIGNSVTGIGNYAFRNCSGLTSVTIGNSVTSIGNYAFYGCSSLTSVTIPNSVTSIGEGAFNYCTGLTSVTNYATTPQSINSYVFGYVDKSTCVLYVPKESVSLYQAANVWKEFTNIVGVDVPDEDPEEPIETVEGNYTINYVDKDSQDLYNHVVTLYVPVAPTITGFTFLKWVVVGGDLVDTITIQAVYQADVPSSAPAVYTNPANPAQKLIKNGNVYILTEDKTYTITGTQVK